jgi:integrase
VGHIEKRTGPKKWRARYRDPSGRERNRSFERRAEAERFLTAIESAKDSDAYIDPSLGRVRLQSFAEKWLMSVQPPTLKPKTWSSYRSLLNSRVLPALGDRPLASIKTSDVQAWIAAMHAERLSPSRIRQAHVTLRQILESAVRDGVVARNAAQGVKLPRLQHREAAFFEPDVVERIAENMPAPYDLLTLTLGTLGLRWGEAVALRGRHVDLLRRRLRVEESLAEISGHLVFGSPKSHANRTVPLTPRLLSALGAHLESVRADDLVFTAPEGGPLRHRNFTRRLWHPTLKRLSLPAVGLHVLRHSAAARLIGAGASPKALQQVLGHRSAAFSLTVYGHIFETDLDDLAAKLDSPAATSRPEPVHFLTVEAQK